MRIPEDSICKICKKMFCCAKCRHKHELNSHAIVIRKPININNAIKSTTTDNMITENNETIYLMCPICEEKPLMLQSEMFEEMLEHIQKEHLPLRCQKCAKVYVNKDDLKNFGKCLNSEIACNDSVECSSTTSDQTCDTEASKITVTKATTAHSSISTQTSPMRREFGATALTPIAVTNVHMIAKSKIQEEFISDSVSSIKNLSTISNCSIRRSIGTTANVKGKLIRSTSTPVQLEMVFAKPKEQAFNATSDGHVSSIYGSSSESDISPAVPNNPTVTPKQPMENANRYRKVGGRVKLSAVTPLRQVMSKSIQKAFAEHGGLPTRGSIGQNKNIFDSINSSADLSGQAAPLDLRSTPVMRRTQSECYPKFSEYAFVEPTQQRQRQLQQKQKQQQQEQEQRKQQQKQQQRVNPEVFLTSQKLTTESITITRTEHKASLETTTNNASDNKLNAPNAINNTNNSNTSNNSNNTNNSTSSGGNRSSSNTVYKSCHSVEIITSTHVNGTMEQNICRASVEREDKLQSMRHISHINKDCANIPTLTPITRIPGAQINKKLIKFETPRNESVQIKNTTSPSGDVFFTPDSTPMRKTSADIHSSEKKRQLIARNLTFSALSRPSIRDCAQSTAFSRIEDCSDTFDDDVFFSETVREDDGQHEEHSGGAGTGRLWSLMSSVIRLTSLKPNNIPNNVESVEAGTKSRSILKRCASIAGSFVRSKPLVDNDQLQSLKRKRTYTTDQTTYISHANCTDDVSCSLSTKRLRIQARKPIERMRMKS